MGRMIDMKEREGFVMEFKPRHNNLKCIKSRVLGNHSISLNLYEDTEQKGFQYYGIAVDCFVTNTGTLQQMRGKFRQWIIALNRLNQIDAPIPHKNYKVVG